ncbi:OmpA family protein [Thalassococcus sp. S3]|uniref:OmpA family protein n=1 Tax=Thalassococcus sp. S3 TaxID=2017482 RepID=UPI00352FDE21
MRFASAMICALFAAPVWAVDLAMPGNARLIADRASAYDSYILPVGPFVRGVVPSEMVEGRVERQSWRIDSSAITTLQILDPLRQQIAEAGFETLFECEATICGGFDFRFAIEVIPAPDMHVDIRDYRFLAARSDEGEVLSLLISRSRSVGYVQVIHVNPEGQTRLLVTNGGGIEGERRDTVPANLAERLLADGHVVLSDLDFGTGTDALNNGPYASLQQLAGFLRENPDMVVALVGHTDSVGSLDNNIALSKRRADAVRARLSEVYEIPQAQMRAEGMGYLAPKASNLTQAGRELNRRVEAILLYKN